jgi:hypothetical protein
MRMNETVMRPLARPPDPILSASIYASGLLDDLISKAIAPFRRESQRTMERRPDLWLVRYGRGGEHLKVRLHGDLGDAGLLKQLLDESVGRYFDSVQSIQPSSRVINATAPPIDPEDETLAPPDRSINWTHYRRSAVTLPWPWLEDDGFNRRNYECLARGCELVLAGFEKYPMTAAARDRLLIKLSLDCLRAFGLLERDAARAYLSYHRDWLLRFFLNDVQLQRRVLDHLTEQVKRRLAAVEQLAGLFHASPEDVESTHEKRWRIALSDLNAYMKPFQGVARYEVDEFAPDVRFLPLFKLLHGLANQAGMPPLQEAFIHHLLIAAAGFDRRSGL